MHGHPVADGVMAGRVDRLDSDTQLADGRRHQDPRRRGGERLPVDEHRAGDHACSFFRSLSSFLSHYLS